MIIKTLSRKIAAIALVLAASAGTFAVTTTSASATPNVGDVFGFSGRGTYSTGYLTYTGTQVVVVDANVTDATGDAYCTTFKAAVYANNGAQLGNDITVGSVCSGRQAWLPSKRISVTVAAGKINHVLLWTTKGANGLSNGGLWCYRTTDNPNGLATC